MSNTRGKFITFEGGEGAGKTTQAERLATALERNGYEVLHTREPGGTFGAEAIRDLVLSGTHERWSGMTELLLMYAARIDHIEKLIEPALARGVWVISDRFYDSTMAYQGYARGVDIDRINAVHDAVMNGFAPDLTILFDIDPILSQKRVETRGEELSRFDSETLDFHKKIRTAFLAIADKEPGRVKIVDAASSRGDISTQILRIVADSLDGVKFV
ncbi:MAG: dTMP kinase [Robiginitomaculum sp.]